MLIKTESDMAPVLSPIAQFFCWVWEWQYNPEYLAEEQQVALALLPVVSLSIT